MTRVEDSRTKRIEAGVMHVREFNRVIWCVIGFTLVESIVNAGIKILLGLLIISNEQTLNFRVLKIPPEAVTYPVGEIVAVTNHVNIVKNSESGSTKRFNFWVELLEHGPFGVVRGTDFSAGRSKLVHGFGGNMVR